MAAVNGSTSTPAARVLARVLVYYAIIALLGALAWSFLPRTRVIASNSLDSLFGAATEIVRGSGKNMEIARPDQGTLAATVMLAMLAAAALALPVAWIYT